MGVFAGLFRRLRTTEEAQSAEAEIPQPAATAAATATAEATDAAPAAEGTAEAESGPRPMAAETARPGADGGVAIPGQQSAKDVADSESDESART